METTGLALVQHWDWAASKGLMNANSARVLRNACYQILFAVFGEEWEVTDVKEADANSLFIRFQNLRGKDLTPRSLQDYKRRFQQALESFRAYVTDPASWKGPGQERAPRSEVAAARDRARPIERKSTNAPKDDDALIEYPFPLGELTARLILPRTLRMADARRLSSFIASLATDWETTFNGRPLLTGPSNS